MTTRNTQHATRSPALPFVRMNMAMTADGKIATASRAVSSFGSARDRRHLHELRATADAVMCGARTVDQERVTLGPGGKKYQRLRLRHGRAEFNLRVIVSGSGSLNPQAHIFTQRFSPVIVLTTGRASETQLRRLRAVATEVKVFGKRELNLRAALVWLRRKWNVRQLLCEGGGELNDALFRAGLVDELHVTLCPLIFGGRNAPTMAEGRGFAKLAEAAPLRLAAARRVEDELYLVYCRGDEGKGARGGKGEKAKG